MTVPVTAAAPAPTVAASLRPSSSAGSASRRRQGRSAAAPARRGRSPQRPQPPSRRAPARTPSSPTTTGTASRSRPASASQKWLAANNATADTPLYVGDELCIPVGATAPAPPPATTQPPQPRPPRRRPQAPSRRQAPVTTPRPAPVATPAPPATPAAAPAAPAAVARPGRAGATARQRRGADPGDLARRPRGAGAHHRQARERPEPERAQLLLLRGVRHLLRDGQELPPADGHHVGRSSCSTPGRTSRRRTSCTRWPDGSPGCRPTPAADARRIGVPIGGGGPVDSPVAQPRARSSMDRASDYGSEGWGFDSLRARSSGPDSSWVGVAARQQTDLSFRTRRTGRFGRTEAGPRRVR